MSTGSPANFSSGTVDEKFGAAELDAHVEFDVVQMLEPKLRIAGSFGRFERGELERFGGSGAGSGRRIVVELGTDGGGEVFLGLIEELFGLRLRRFAGRGGLLRVGRRFDVVLIEGIVFSVGHVAPLTVPAWRIR